MRGRAEGLLDVDVVALAPFLTANTSEPSRALLALKWFSKHGALLGMFSLCGHLPARPQLGSRTVSKQPQHSRGWRSTLSGR